MFYRKTIALIFILFLAMGLVVIVLKTKAAELTTPVISISPDTFYPLDELLYIEGRALPDAAVTVNLQKSGERPVKFTVKSDSTGEWSLAEKVFLPSGDWEVRARMVLETGDFSDWSNPRIVRAVVTGFTIFGFTIKYLTIALALFLLFGLAIAFLVYSILKVKKIRELEQFKKREEEIKVLQKRVLEGEVATVHATIAEGFSTLRHDLINELKGLEEQSRLTGQSLSSSDVEKREHIIKELYEIEEEIGKKLKDVKGAS